MKCESGEQCLQRLYTSDRTYRTLLRNDVLTQLQELEAEGAYQARCEQQAAGRSAASVPGTESSPTVPARSARLAMAAAGAWRTVGGMGYCLLGYWLVC